MAIGYMTVFHMFSVGINSVEISDQYQRAVTLANSKLSEIEMMNYETVSLSGTFENEENFQWSLNIEPYDSPLNVPDKNINLSKVTLKVTWKDNQKPRHVELATLKLDGEIDPAPDSQLASVFGSSVSASDSDSAEDPTEDTSDDSTSSASGSTGSSTSGSSGTTDQNISGAPQSPSQNISGL